jgi:DNA-damage-inducible protein J
MTKTESKIQVRIDTKTKKKAKKTLEEIGIDMSSAVKLFLRNVVITGSIPLNLRTENGFTMAEEKEILQEAKEALKSSKGYKSAEELHRSILK